MKSYERNRILVDQCTGCGGLFLDKGELEQLAAAENAWHAASAVASPPAAQPPGYDDPRRDEMPRYDDRRRDDRSHYDDRHDGGSYRPRKKKSFLSDLFDD